MLANRLTMKKISLIALMICSSTVLFAQHLPTWGIKGGINLASWHHADKDVQDVLESRLGFHVGILSHNHISNKIAIQPELQFSTQGTEVERGDNDIEYRTSYLNVPVMIQYMFDNGFRVEAGPYVGFLLGAKDVSSSGTEIDAKDDYKKVDAGVGVGLNYLSYSGFGVGGRYNFGLANINDRLGDKIQNRVFQLSVFYMFDKNHKAKSR
jgi:hypothetical protein